MIALQKQRTVQTQSGTLLVTKVTIIPIKTTRKTMMVEALINEKLPIDLLRVTPIITKLGAILLDKVGAAVIPQHTQ